MRKQLGTEELMQQAHFDRVSINHELHNADIYTKYYRVKFIYDLMSEKLELGGKRVLDAMSGGGYTVGYLLSKEAKVTGLDISPKVVETFQRQWPEVEIRQASVLDTQFEDASFDHIFVVGGLHHMHPYLNETLDELYRILKSGGYLCFYEPHAGALPDMVRLIWYKFDNFFEKNEKAIDLEALMAVNEQRFDFVKTQYGGNLAYLFVLNSSALRIPLGWKKYYSKPLMAIEGWLNQFQGERLSCAVVGQWRKKELIG